MAEGRDERRARLDAVVETIKRERDVFPLTPALAAECEDALERCLFDRDAALAVLRGEHELDDDPWARCPDCECDTYFRVKVELGGPVWMFVCEGCQHTLVRPRATVDEGLWWEQGERMRARPEDVGHPYRGNAVDEDDDEEEAPETDAEEPPVEWAERKVCPDGACIGVIGDDGRCKVCGRTGETSGGEIAG